MKRISDEFFRDLVDAHYEGLYRFARSLCRNEDQACDLTQQTFTIFAEKGRSLRDPGKAKSWLFTTLYREFLRLYRQNRRIEHHDPEVMEEVLPVVETPQHNSLDQQRILSALDELEETFRAPLVLFYLRDFSYVEIADILGIPIGTVMSRLSRGKTRLKKIFLESSELTES